MTTPHEICALARFRTLTLKAPPTTCTTAKFSGGSNFKFKGPCSDVKTSVSPSIKSTVCGSVEILFTSGSHVSLIFLSAIFFVSFLLVGLLLHQLLKLRICFEIAKIGLAAQPLEQVCRGTL